jgi:hypothetical protein
MLAVAVIHHPAASIQYLPLMAGFCMWLRMNKQRVM